MIKSRDQARKAIRKAGNEKQVLQQKYKILRNRVTSALKTDTRMMNEKRAYQATNENEMWKIVKEIANPRTDKQWMLKENCREIREEEEIAEVFNEFFISKITNLRANIGREYVKDPLKKLRNILKN